MSELRFDGRTAVVTGAGRGIGAAVARLLAARGARVVVNDLGSDVGGAGRDSDPADQVAASIREAGGLAVASYADISTEDGAQSAVGAALTEFGGLDILVNCAGILRPDNIDDIDLAGFQRVTGVHVRGSLLMCRAAWPQLKKQGYGRVVLTISAGFLGSPGALSYATGKGGIVSLGRSLARSGAAAGIKVNLFMPSADTRMIGISSIRNASGRSAASGAASKGSPDDVAPLAAFLAHEQVPVSGEMFSAANANVSRLFVAETRGFSAPGRGRVGLEDLRDHWQQVMDTDGYAIPVDSAAHGRFKSTGAV